MRPDGWPIGAHTSASSVLTNTQTTASYAVNASGVPLGTGTVWTGMSYTMGPAGSGQTCGNWSDASMSANIGYIDNSANFSWAATFATDACTNAHPWYCIQVGP